MVQDFATDSYAEALKEMFVQEGIKMEVSEEIIFETPYDEMADIITSTTASEQQMEEWIEKFVSYNKASAQRAIERKDKSLALSQSFAERYSGGNAYVAKSYIPKKKETAVPEVIKFQDVATGKVYTFDSSKFTKEELEKLLVEE